MVTLAPKMLTGFRRRIQMLIGRGEITLSDDSDGHQRVQAEMLADELLDNVERMQEYGFTGRPPAGSTGVFVFLSGARANGVCISAEHRASRVRNLAEGEVAVYTDEGDVIYFRRGRLIEINSGGRVKVTAPDVEVVASTKVTITSPLTAISQNVTIGGTLAVAGQITGQGGMAISGGSGAQVTGNISVTGGNVTADGVGLKTHHHTGVQTGSGNTGGPVG